MPGEPATTDALADLDFDTIGFVRSSQYRVAVITALAEKPCIPSEIAEQSGFSPSHISRALSDLRERGLVELLVDEDRKRGRYYGLTQEGQTVHDGYHQIEEGGV